MQKSSSKKWTKVLLPTLVLTACLFAIWKWESVFPSPLIDLKVATMDPTSSEKRSSVTMDEQLIALALADPESDAQKSISSGDLRAVGIMGVDCITPGIDAPTKGVKVIVGTNDFIQNRKQERLQRLAEEYASAYNAVLKPHLGSGQR